MRSTDEEAFALMLAGFMTDVYDKAVKPTLINIWIASLQPYEWAEVRAAFERHLTDPDAGRFPPKPADIIRHLQALQPDNGPDGHPGPEEAWGLLIRFITDERETGLYTEPMRAAWQACDPILKLGDEVGARMCFLETYRKALQRAKETRNPPKWSLTMGSDIERRKRALQEAVAAQRISADYAQSLLLAPVASLEHLTGLLEHDGSKPEMGRSSFRERLREIAAQLRQNDDEGRAVNAEMRRHAQISARQQQIEAAGPAYFQRRAA